MKNKPKYIKDDIVKSRAYAEKKKCPRCGSRNKIIEGLTIDDKEVGYNTICCDCGNISTFYRNIFDEEAELPKVIPHHCKKIKYGGVCFGHCNHSHICKLAEKKKCRTVTTVACANGKGWKGEEGRYTSSDNDEILTITDAINDKYR